MSSYKWACRRCAKKKRLVIDATMTQIRECSYCGVDNFCTIISGSTIPPAKKVKRRLKHHVRQVRIPTKVNTQLKKVARNRGCSVHSLIMSYIDNGLNPPLIQTQTGYIPAPVERPPAVGLPPSRKKGEKDALVAEVEKHPMFIKQRKKYK